MTTATTTYFLLIFHVDTNELEIEEFVGDELAATTAYSAREHEYREDTRIEVVLVGADSLETVRKTHSHYFARSNGNFVADVEREFAAALDGPPRS